MFISSSLRLFIALNLPSTVKTVLYQQTDVLRQQIPQVRWVAPENLHLTLKFLGDVSQEKIPELEAALQKAVAACGNLALQAKGVGCFPNVQRPRVVWLGLAGELEKLKQLAGQIETGLAAIGYPKETRPFSPHLTIGRVKERKSPAIGESLKKFGVMADWQNDTVDLMQSTLKPSGSQYTTLAKFRLD